MQIYANCMVNLRDVWVGNMMTPMDIQTLLEKVFGPQKHNLNTKPQKVLLDV